MNKLDDHQFEQDLARALEHVDAPAGFQQRVLARAAADAKAARVLAFAPPGAVSHRRWYAIAAMLLVAVLALSASLTYQAQQRRRHAENERQYELAMEVERQTLAETRQQLQDAGIDLRPRR